jgi:hypothetical protein
VCPQSNSMMSRPVQSSNFLWPMPLFAVDRARSVERCHHEMTYDCFSFHLLLAECRYLMLASAIHEIRVTFEPSHCETGRVRSVVFFQNHVHVCDPAIQSLSTLRRSVHIPSMSSTPHPCPHPTHLCMHVHTPSMPKSAHRPCPHAVHAHMFLRFLNKHI